MFLLFAGLEVIVGNFGDGLVPAIISVGETSSVIVSRTEPSCVMLHRTYTRDAVTITDTFFVVCSNLLIAFAVVDVWLRRGITSRVWGGSIFSLVGRAVDAATEVRP